MASPIPEHERGHLFSSWCDGSLSVAQAERLDSLVRTDAEFRKLFLEYMDLHAILSVDVNPAPASSRAGPDLRSMEGEGDEGGEGAVRRIIGGAYGSDARPATFRLPGHWAGSRMWRAAAAAVLLVGVAALLRSRDRQEAMVVSRPPLPNASLAVVINQVDAHWDASDGPAPVETGMIAARRLRLQSGLATLAFLSGVTLTLEGPADVDLVSIDHVFCRRGRLRARVPKGAEGFVVASPRSAVVDAGTEFALNVGDDGKSHVMVFEGSVEAALLDEDGSSRRVQFVGRGRSFDLDSCTGRIAESAARPEGFIPTPDLPVPALTLDPAYSTAILSSRPRGYWRFETLAAAAIPNEVPGGPPMRVNGPVAIDGAAANGCAVFRAGAPEQFLSTDVLWELARAPGHAIELWFWSEGYSYASLVSLFPPRELNVPAQTSRYLHSFLLELTAHDRQSLHKPASIRLLHRWPLDIQVQVNTYSAGVYIPRHWHHVVAQKQGDLMQVYLDGAPARPLVLDSEYPTLACNLVVGRRTPDTLDPKDSRSFVGRLDELAIYDHTLTAEEVHHHFQLANPGTRRD
jgi:Concanavalin A-like lectin/glucanases superfamily/FecR protein